MWHGYYYKLVDRWTEPLFGCPRWLSVCGLPTLTDAIELPVGIEQITTTVSSSANIIPTPLLLSSSSNVTGSAFDTIIESVVHDAEYLKLAVQSILSLKTFGVYLADPEYGYIVELKERPETVMIKTESGSAVLPAAEGLHSLLYGGNYGWVYQDGLLLVYGLHILQQSTELDDIGWNYIPDTSRYDGTGQVWVEHPSTKNWIPISYLDLGDTGQLPYYSASPINVRATVREMAQDSFDLIIDGTIYNSRKVDIPNSVDILGLYQGLTRRGENNESFSNVILASSWFGSGQTEDKLKAYISCALRRGEVVTVSAGATGFTLPSQYTGYIVKNKNKTMYRWEIGVSPYDSSTYKTMVADPEYGALLLHGIPREFTETEGIISLSVYSRPEVDAPDILWKINRWEVQGNAIQYTDNMESEDVTIYYTEGVDINTPSQATLLKMYERYSPTLRWSHNRVEDNESASTPAGLATFDF